MKRAGGGFAIGIMVMLFAGLGVGAAAVRAKNDHGRITEYNAYVESARERAEKGIYFYAKTDYLAALAVYSGDRGLFQEFLSFLKDAQDPSYVGYLKTYIKRYPQDAEPYEALCRIYYEEGRYRDVQTLLLEAQAAGVTSGVLTEYEALTLYEFTYLGGAYQNISPFYGEQAIVEENGKKGLYYYDIGMVIPAEYDEITYYINGAAAVKKDGECYFVDFYGNKSGVPEGRTDSLSILSNGFTAVSADGKYGYMSGDLEVPKELPYEGATSFSEEIAGVKSEGGWGLIDRQGRYVVEPQYEEFFLTQFGSCVSSGVIFARLQDGYVMLDREGNRLNEYVFEEVRHFSVSGQPAAVKLDGKWCFVKKTGELFLTEADLEEAKSFDNMLAPVTLDGESWGYMDGYGNMVIEPQFDDCRQFSPYGIAPVKKGDAWFMIQLLRYQK